MKLLPILLFLTGSMLSHAEEHGRKRPNFLFIVTDDQRWDAIAAVQKEQGEKARFPWLQTPILDRLHAEGASFSNAFCTTSLCSPGRASLLTGQYTHTHGVTNNHTPFQQEAVTYATVLRQAGYTTGYVGKWHMGDQPERPGFDFSASFRGQGKFFNCPIIVRKNGTETKVIAEKWVDDTSADYAVDFLKENREKTFLLTVGFKSVHGPREPHGDYQTLYEGEDARKPANADAPAPFRPEGAKNSGAKVLDYFRTLTSVDRSLGRILSALKQQGLDRNTIVIFTSDNGYYLGEHGLGDKRSAYEESLRLPLIIRSPFHTVAGKKVQPMVLNIDLAPTIVDLAGLPVPPQFQGHSLKPLLEERLPEDWRKSFLYEYFYERNFRNPTILGLRTLDDKIITYPGREEWNEIFEIGKDPYELKNQWSNPEKSELKARLQADLEKLKKDTGYQVPEAADPDQFGKEKPARKNAKNDPES